MCARGPLYKTLVHTVTLNIIFELLLLIVFTDNDEKA